eukprot:6063494-Prymnesium_polylepis.1
MPNGLYTVGLGRWPVCSNHGHVRRCPMLQSWVFRRGKLDTLRFKSLRQSHGSEPQNSRTHSDLNFVIAMHS